MPEISEIVAPFPGVFYRRANQDSAPLAEPGQVIAVGRVIALIEVMKMFHEVQSAVAGKITEFCAEDGDAVAMGQIIAKIERQS